MPKTAEKPTGSITIRVDDEILERRFREKAAKEDATPSQILRNAMRQYVGGRSPRRQLAVK